ncbi:MAG TPA: serine/threonine-protein kinase, partial [Kofleriaceae bacterium]
MPRYVCPACGELGGAAGECSRDGTAYERCDGDPLVGEDVAGYRIVQLIGRGGMGRVYRAVQRSIGAHVAIKVLSHELAHDPEVAERFVAEPRIANLVRHDALVQILGLGVLADGRPYQVMEHLVGASLASLLERHGALPVGRMCELVREALGALQALHERGIVHRDVKPSNLFVTAGGRLKLLDFGIAKLRDGRNLTHSGQSLGTPEYMAPEQAAGGRVDHRADLYALGVVLFEGVTGERPFAGRAVDALVERDAPPAVAPAALDAVIRTAMQHDRTRRFGSAREMEAALGALIATLGPDAFAPAGGCSVHSTDEIAPTGERGRSPAPAIPERLGRYAVEGVLGRGGAGIVLFGVDRTINRRVALKVLDVPGPDRRGRLVAEARAMARVNHPNVLALYELGQDGDAMFLALELVEGSDLAHWLASARRPWRAIVEQFVAAGYGLAAAHDAGVVHRDFKPANVLVGRDGRPRVCDFGLADHGAGARAGGTPAYMAPEQLDGVTVDARADQFAFAAALWEAVFGELPYAGDSATALVLAARRGALRAPTRSDLPDRIHRALRRALSASPDRRFPTMAELLAELAPFASARPRPWRRWLIAGALGALAVAAA